MLKLIYYSLLIPTIMVFCAHGQGQVLDYNYLSQLERSSFVELHLKHLEVQALRAEITNYPPSLEIEGHSSKLNAYQRLSEFLLATAYAESREGKCIFGGWPSFKVNGVCKTPWNFSSDEELTLLGPTYSSDYYCGAKNLFRCNPTLFGPGQDGKGRCIRIKNYENLTLNCFKHAKETPEEIFERYRNDPIYRRQYLNMVEEVTKFCLDASGYDACRSLIASVSSAKNFICDDKSLDQLLGSERFKELEGIWGSVEGELIKNEGRAQALAQRVRDHVEVSRFPTSVSPQEVEQLDQIEGDFATYSNSPEVRKMLETLQRNTKMSCSQSLASCSPRRRADYNKSLSKCWRYVKLGLVSGELSEDYIPSEFAVDAGPTLRQRGFVNLLNSKKYQDMTPQTAPPGAIIVYRKVGVRSGRPGHIEVKSLDNTFISDFESQRSIDQYLPREVVGIYINPNIGN